jgi:dienelactone hydrolase
MRYLLAILILGFCPVIASASDTIAIPAEYQGRQIQVEGRFDRPAVEGPLPVVILLPNSSGMFYYAQSSLPTYRQLINSWGFSTLVLDSFSARGLRTVVGKGASIVELQATDAYSAAEVLASRSDVKADKIAVLGQSMGGWSLVQYVARDLPKFASLRAQLAARSGKLVAGVAISPDCDLNLGAAVVVPLLILTGALDDWSPPAPCSELAAAPANSRTVHLTVYPNAYHNFESPGPPTTYLGHRLEYNVAAAQDARTKIHDFLFQYFKY